MWKKERDEDRKKEKKEKIEEQIEKENKEQNFAILQFLPNFSSFTPSICLYLVFFCTSSFELYMAVFILTGNLMEPERLLREKEEREKREKRQKRETHI